MEQCGLGGDRNRVLTVEQPATIRPRGGWPRALLGQSSDGARRRSACKVRLRQFAEIRLARKRVLARELARLLDRSGVSGPSVLVGASIGGFPVRLFASDYAERVAGLVLVDATHEDQLDEVPRLAAFVPLLSSTGVLRLLGVSSGLRPTRWRLRSVDLRGTERRRRRHRGRSRAGPSHGHPSRSGK
jgi:pimeloyl-ACP methyl ester carboxylesterase